MPDKKVQIEKDEDGEDLKASGQHIQNKNELGERTEKCVIAGWACGVKTGANVIQAGQRGRKIGFKGVAVNRKQKRAEN